MFFIEYFLFSLESFVVLLRVCSSVWLQHTRKSSCLAYRQCRGFVYYRHVENVSHSFLRLSPLQYHQHYQSNFICNLRISLIMLNLCGNLANFFCPSILINFIHEKTKFHEGLTIFSTCENNFPIYRIFNFADTTHTQFYTENTERFEHKVRENVSLLAEHKK